MDEQVREGGNLWMGKLGREEIGVSKQHSPTGKCRWMVKSGREENGVSKGMHQRMGKSGRDIGKTLL